MSVPKTIGGKIDRLFRLRTKRLEQQRAVDDLRAQEREIEDELISTLGKDRLNKAAGKLASVSVQRKTVPSVVDWDKFYKYVKKENAFELLQKRVNISAARERWDDGEDLPGVEQYIDTKISLRKI